MKISNLNANIFEKFKNIIDPPNQQKTPANIQNLPNENLSEFNITNEENLNIILSTIGILPNEKNLSIVKLLLNSSLPLNKENFKNISNNLNIFNEFPFEKLEVLLKNNIELTKSNATKLDNILSNELNLTNQISKLFSIIENKEDFENIIKIFTKNENLANEGKIIITELNNLKSKLLTNILKNSELFNKLSEKLQQEKNIEFSNLQNTDNLNLENIFEHVIEEFLPKKIITNQNLLSSFEDKINEYFSKDSIKKNTKNTDFPLIEKEIFKLILKSQDSREIKKFISKIIKFQKNLNENLSFKFKNSSVEGLNEYFNKIHENIKVYKSYLKDAQINNKQIKICDDVEETIQFMTELKNTPMLQFPIYINNHQTTAQLFVFKDKKNKLNRNNPNTGSALLSLDLANLGLLETYINKINNDVYCQFRICNKEIKNFIKENIYMLNSYLKEKSLNLKEVSFKEIDRNFSLISNDLNNNLEEQNICSFNKQA